MKDKSASISLRRSVFKSETSAVKEAFACCCVIRLREFFYLNFRSQQNVLESSATTVSIRAVKKIEKVIGESLLVAYFLNI